MLKPDSEGVGLWRKSVNGIGRQRGDFQIRISLEPSEKFDAGVAIDDLGKHTHNICINYASILDTETLLLDLFRSNS